MASYSTTVTATSNAAADTEDSFLDITPPAGVSVLLKRVRVSIETAAQDTRSRVAIKRKSVQGAGSVAGTIIEKRPAGPAAVSTTQVKNAAIAFAAGTIVDIVDEVSVNGRAIFEWVPRGPEEIIMTGVAQIIGINILCSAVSIIHRVTAEWEE